MTKLTSALVATCPDCGGILQPVALEQLTSSEVSLGEAALAPTLHLQCLLCGYEEDRAADEAAQPA